MRRWIGVCVVCVSLLATDTVQSEMVTTSAEQKELNVTIYNGDLALIRDTRELSLPGGEVVLAYKEISSSIMPETALLKGDGLEVIEQNFEFDLLTPTSLLNKYVGRTVTLVRKDGSGGEERRVEARVLSNANGVVLQVGDQIETEIDGRLIYPDVPDNLRDRPTLTMLVSSERENTQEVELAYLTTGLNWKADYVVELHGDEIRADIKGWVTLTNKSGTSYGNARLQLVAGEVHRAPVARQEVVMAMPDMAERAYAAPQRRVAEESLFEYHLYTVDRPTTLLENQSKQIALLQENNGICVKELVLKSPHQGYYWSKVGEIQKSEGVEVFLKMKNDKGSNLGLPKPAGVVRVYTKDSGGFSQFIGEDRIGHTPENELIEIKLGQAFDVTADRVQTDFSQIRSMDRRRINESGYEITLKNAKSEETVVLVEEQIPGEWEILSENRQHTRKNANTVTWKVAIPAKGSTTLEYTVRTVL